MVMTLPKLQPRDIEGERLFALYETSSAREITATYNLLYPSHSQPHDAYMALVGDLRVIRTEANDNRLAIAAHHRRLLDSSVETIVPEHSDV
jgi:hypothetical protein